MVAYEAVLTALSDSTRRAILERLLKGPRPVGEIAAGLPVTRAAVSQHLRVLKAAGLVSARRVGNRRVYRLERSGLLQLRAYVERFWDEALESFREAAEAAKEVGMSREQVTELVVRKSVRVPLRVAEAFRLYTEGIGSWWPMRAYSVGQDRTVDVVFESGVGGRLFERLSDGAESVWGRIVVWDPPRRVVHTWHPARDEETSQEVELTFTADGDGTRLNLEHRGWEKLGEKAAETAAGYEQGWDTVLDRYLSTARP